MIQHSENSRREMTNAEAGVVGAVLGFGLIALLLYLAVDRYHIRKEQLVEAGLYLFVIAAAGIAPVLRQFTTRGNRAEHGTAFIADNISLIPANNAVQAAAAVRIAKI